MLRNWSLNPLAKVAIGILRKYGADAHVYLPGIGTVNGLTAGNYLDSAGTTAATVDNPVGLSLDALQAMTLGSELVTNGTFDTNITGWVDGEGGTPSWVTGAIQRVSTTGGGSYQDVTVTSNTSYVVSVGEISKVSGTGAVVWAVYDGAAFTTSLTGTVSGVQSMVVKPSTSVLRFYLYNDGSSVGRWDNVSIKQIPGIHATQATTANKPILRQSGGKYSWQFDQSNDFLQTAITTGDAGWLCAGVTFTDSNSTLFCSGAGNASSKGLWNYREAASDTFITLIGNGTAPTSPASIAAPAGQPLVIASGWDASNIFHSVNSTETTASRTGSASPSPSTLRIGAYTNGTTYPLGGNMNIALVFNVLPTADERLTLKRFVGQLSGVSI